MNLTLKDRVLILNTVLPQFDTRKNMELKIAIDKKIAISDTDQKRIVVNDFGGGKLILVLQMLILFHKKQILA